MKRRASFDWNGVDWRNVAYYARGVFAVVLAFSVLAGGGWYAYSKIHEAYVEFTTPDDDYVGEGTGVAEVVIPRGAGITQIGDILYEAGVVKSVRKFRNVAQQSGQSSDLQAGRFVLKKELPAETALAMLLDPANLKRIWITFPEGTNVKEQQARMIKELGISQKDIDAAVARRAELGLPSWAGDDLQGYLFPARYAVEEPISAFAIMQTQVKQFNLIAKRTDLVARAGVGKRDPKDVLTVASIVEGEVHDPDYQPMVAAVIYNRLAKGMMLEMDSTVHFVVGKSGSVTTTAEDRETQSPYNTYLHKGLPPGPINNPGETAINAALSPADTDALYFVTVNLDTGETLFANTYEEHKVNVEKFQAYCQANPGKCTK